MKTAVFEKVSERQFDEDLKKLLAKEGCFYENIVVPKRATSGSAGYDFHSPVSVDLKPGESIRIPTGIRCHLNEEYLLQIYPRSSMGFKYQMCLMNTVGIIDSDYYYADNEGHIIVGIVNRGDRDLHIEAGDRFVQGVITRYYTTDDDDCKEVRHGGFGSTDCAHSSKG